MRLGLTTLALPVSQKKSCIDLCRLLYFWIEKTQALTRRLKRVKVTSEQRRIDGEKKRIYTMNVKEFSDLCERFKI